MQRKTLFILIDALRARNLGCYGYSKPTSPNIDNLARDGTLFEDAYSCAVLTDPSLTTIFSGKYPRSHGIVRHGAGVTKEDVRNLEDSGTSLLQEILRASGYKTFAVDWLGRWHKRGYDYYSGALNPKKLKLYHLGKRIFKLDKLSIYLAHTKLIDDAKSVTDKAIGLLKKNYSKKFFLFVHYWDTHIPYNPPKSYLEKFLDFDYGNHQSIDDILNQFDSEHASYMKNRVMNDVKNVNEILARYDGAVAYVDYQISRLIGTLESLGILDETFLILTSDHGESLTEHGIYFGHHGLYDETIHVPLIFKCSAFPRNQRIKGFIQHIDLVPTTLDFLNIKTNLEFDGTSAIPLIDNETEQLRTQVFAEEADAERKRAIRTSTYKYIGAFSKEDAVCRGCGRIHGDIEELYDLTTDPGETENLIKKQSHEARTLKEELSKIVNFLESKRKIIQKEKADRSNFDDEENVKKRLKELGYL